MKTSADYLRALIESRDLSSASAAARLLGITRQSAARLLS